MAAIPVGTISGGPVSGKIRRYECDGTQNDAAIFVGDFITMTAAGYVKDADAAGELLLGVCTGVQVDRSVAATEHPGYLPASTAGYIYVAVGEDVIYEIGEDADTDPLDLADIGSNCDIAFGAGSTTTGKSGHVLDSSTHGAGSDVGVKILGISDRVGTGAASQTAGTNWLVSINETNMGSNAVGI